MPEYCARARVMNSSSLVGLVLVFRHGQRAPYPPAFATSWADAAAVGWTTRPGGFEDMTHEAWNMSSAAFADQELNGNGQKLLRHMGERVSVRASPLHAGDPCKLPALLVADDSTRDVQSAQAFVSGFYPSACASARAASIVVANVSSGLHPATTDNFTALCGSGAAGTDLELLFGSYEALTERYRPQMRKVSQILGCCSADLCRKFGHVGGTNCTIDELPYTYNGVYWQGLTQGPLTATAVFAQAWMLQQVSGFGPPAWGELSMEELQELYRAHMRLMWLGSNLNRSTAVGSHLLAFVLASLEQLVPSSDGVATPLPGAAPGSQPLVALFAHDFNLLYLRRLLRASWLTESWPFDAASTGSSISFELHRDAQSAESASSASYRVVGVYEAASIEQQSFATPLVPPYAPPGRSVFLDVPLPAFRETVLEAIEPRCVASPLRETVEKLRHPAAGGRGWSWLLQSGGSIGLGACLLVAGCAFGFLAGRSSRQFAGRSSPLLPPKPRQPDDPPLLLSLPSHLPYEPPTADSPGPAPARSEGEHPRPALAPATSAPAS